MKKKLCFLVRHWSSSSCFLSHRYYSFLTAPTSTTTTLQSHFQHLLNLPNPTNPYFCAPTLHFSTQVSTPTTSTTTKKPVSIYLIERLGFSEEQSLAISKKLRSLRDYSHVKQVTDFISFQDADNVISYLQECCGLDLSHIRKVITKYPKILTSDVDKTLKPKITLLQNSGFSTSDLAHCLSGNPALYLKNDLTPIIQALRGILGSDEHVVKVLKRLNYGTSNTIINNLMPNLTMLENEYGLSKMRLRDFLCSRPIVFMLSTETLRDGIVKVEDKWGITRDSTEFLRALHLFTSNSDENIDFKCQVFRSFGWSDSDILSLIRRFPNSLGLSEAMIKKKLDFYMNELAYKPAYMAPRPVMMGLSLENRVFPRHKVLSVLKEKGFIKEDFQLYNALLLNEGRFFEKFILPYEETVPDLRPVYIDGGSAACEADVHMDTFENGTKTPSAAE